MPFAKYPSLADRVVVITGGGSGIGAGLVEAFAANDAKVALLDIQKDASEKLADSLSGARHRPFFVETDLMDIAALRAAIAKVRARFGPVSVLVNNAGNDERHEVDDVTPEYWDRTQDVNLRHQFFAAQAVHDDMRGLGGGSIVNFSSISWIRGGANVVGYATAKAAIVGMTNALARAFGPDNIRVNAILPGAVMTERQLRLWYTEESAKEIADRQIIRKRLLPEHIARAVLFLAADDSSMITKQSLIVDGGLA